MEPISDENKSYQFQTLSESSHRFNEIIWTLLLLFLNSHFVHWLTMLVFNEENWRSNSAATWKVLWQLCSSLKTTTITNGMIPPENIEKIFKIVLYNPKVKLGLLVHIVKKIYFIGMVPSKWPTRLLTV